MTRREPFTWPREECPVETAALVLRLKDGRKVEYEVSQPDAARLLCDYPHGRYPGHEDVSYGGLPIAPPVMIEPPPPLQFTVTFGFGLMRSDPFLRVTETPAEEAASDVR